MIPTEDQADLHPDRLEVGQRNASMTHERCSKMLHACHRDARRKVDALEISTLNIRLKRPGSSGCNNFHAPPVFSVHSAAIHGAGSRAPLSEPRVCLHALDCERGIGVKFVSDHGLTTTT